MNMRLEPRCARYPSHAAQGRHSRRHQDRWSTCRDGKGEIDDIGPISATRRVRSVGELMENQYRIGLLRMERRDQGAHVQCRYRHRDAAGPDQRQNQRPPRCASFFSAPRSCRSSWIRPIRCRKSPTSAVSRPLGPGRPDPRAAAGFEVRDVHPTHYVRAGSARFETPEGPKHRPDQHSLATFARVNKYGFVEKRPIARSRTVASLTRVIYLSAMEEGRLSTSPRPTSRSTNRGPLSSPTTWWSAAMPATS